MPEQWRIYEVRLSLKCETCGVEATFHAPTRKLVEAEARAAGWSLPRRLFAYCDKDKGEPPMFKLREETRG